MLRIQTVSLSEAEKTLASFSEVKCVLNADELSRGELIVSDKCVSREYKTT